MRCFYICIAKNPISLCLHPVPHPNSNTLSRRRRPRSLRESVNSREVCHSPTWHSSKSESARGVSNLQLWLSYGWTVGEVCSHRSPRGDRKRLKEEFFPLFVLFVLFGQAKRTLKEKNHNVTFPLSYFSMTKSTKSHQRERSPLFENSSPCLGDANQRTACIG